MKIRQFRAELFKVKRQTDGWKDGRIDGQTNMTKLIVAFRNLVKMPINQDKFLNNISFASIIGKL